jgi:HD-GYP domain-containing protein (c-di-GMP phosphodiesterase class II)
MMSASTCWTPAGNAPLEVADAESLLDLVRLLKRHDPYTAGHSRRVSAYARVVAEVLGLSERQTALVERAGLAHDVGKLGVPHSLLAKNIGLSSHEFERIRRHPEIGSYILSGIAETTILAPIVLHHHEHWDGGGYPLRLRATDIPLESRLILAVDAFDAMTTARPYDPMISAHAAVGEIVHCGGHQFDPLVVEALEYAYESGSLRDTESTPALLL